ncbi:MAG: hypothetical protein ACREIQ_06825 [Nitrospiria bacterium]
MSQKRVSQAVFCLFLMIFISFSGCRDSITQATNPIKTSKPQTPVEVKLSMQDTPSAGGTVRLTMQVRPLIEAPLISMEFILPEDMERIAGEPSWAGPMAQGEIRTLEITVHLIEEKRYVVQGIATLQQQEGTSYTGIDSLVIDLERSDHGGQYGISTQSPKSIKQSRDEKDVIEFKGK